MNKREWLVSKGLAQGTRGRFSTEAEAAWAEHLRDSGDAQTVGDAPTEVDLPRDGFHLATLPTTYPEVRKENLAYSVDEGNHLIAHVACGDCKRRVNQCQCKGGPWGLSFVKPRQRAYLVVKES
jgi:hypothetical protein